MRKKVENWWEQANRDLSSTENATPYFDIDMFSHTPMSLKRRRLT